MASSSTAPNLPDFEAVKVRIATHLNKFQRESWTVTYHATPSTLLIIIKRNNDYLFDIDDAFSLAFSLHETSSLAIDQSGNVVALLEETRPVVYTGSKTTAMRNRMARILGTLIAVSECRQDDLQAGGGVLRGTWKDAWEVWNRGMGMFFERGVVHEVEDGVDGYWYREELSLSVGAHADITSSSRRDVMIGSGPDFEKVKMRVLLSLDDLDESLWKIDYEIKIDRMKITLELDAQVVFSVDEQLRLAMRLHEADLKVGEDGRVVALYEKSRPVSYSGCKRDAIRSRIWAHLRILDSVRDHRLVDTQDGGLFADEWDEVYSEWDGVLREYFEKSPVDDDSVDMHWYVKE